MYRDKMEQLSSRDLDLIITYLQDDVDEDLKQIILDHLKDHEVNTLYARCISMGTDLIAMYFLREERTKRLSTGSTNKHL